MRSGASAGASSSLEGNNFSVRFPIDPTHYANFLHDRPYARTYIDEILSEHLEIFPAEMIDGYGFNGFTEVSAKLGKGGQVSSVGDVLG